MVEVGFKTERGDPTVAYETARLFFDRDDKLSTRGMHVQEFIEHLSSVDPVKTVADDYVLAGERPSTPARR